jgi:hypothetical protein
MVVDGVSAEAGVGLSSPCASTELTKLRAAMPTSDVTSFIRFFLPEFFLRNGRALCPGEENERERHVERQRKPLVSRHRQT